ncbi:MAG: nicotinate-nucleotide adenylyltransferase [Actinobacteria bacterium]|nr:nicotinate-nucleotide adenylyltransferase [Actinomycetota bacterium]
MESLDKKESLKFGIMGGTFNPIHYGHLVTAEEAFNQFKLDKVIFMPSAAPPHKKDEKIISADDRYLMTVLAVASNKHFSVSSLEIERGGYSYTVDTINALKKRLAPNSKIYFITGADAILEILTWKEPHKLIDFCDFIAATRPGYNLGKFREVFSYDDWQKFKSKISFMEIPALAISSTAIRERIRKGRSVRYLLPDNVIDYISKNRLYIEGD